MLKTSITSLQSKCYGIVQYRKIESRCLTKATTTTANDIQLIHAAKIAIKTRMNFTSAFMNRYALSKRQLFWVRTHQQLPLQSALYAAFLLPMPICHNATTQKYRTHTHTTTQTDRYRKMSIEWEWKRIRDKTRIKRQIDNSSEKHYAIPEGN